MTYFASFFQTHLLLDFIRLNLGQKFQKQLFLSSFSYPKIGLNFNYFPLHTSMYMFRPNTLRLPP